MKTLFAVAVFVLCVLEGDAFLENVLAKVLKYMSKDCPRATDMKCPREDVTFWFYTKSTQDNPLKLNQFDLDSLKKVPFVDGPLKFIVHGYSVDKDTAVNEVLRPAYFAHGDYNIISVDWSPLGKPPCYYAASISVPTIAHCIAIFFDALVKAHKFSSVHLLGHSMGAHLAAQASLALPDLPRLTEFDPANPMFGDMSGLLKKGTAKVIVDVYHSNCNLKGRHSADGIVDVYFNNGIFQPGCGCGTGCSHLRAVEFYAESIGNPKKMAAFPCQDWDAFCDEKCPVPSHKDLVFVGEDIDAATKGKFMMFTGEKTPFFLEYSSVYLNSSLYWDFKKTASISCKMYDLLSVVKEWLD